MKVWRKKTIKELKAQLLSFVLYNERYYPPEAIRKAIAENRLEIITKGLESWRSMITARADQERATADHYEKVEPQWRAEALAKRGEKDAEKTSQSCKETAERFRKLAHDGDKTADYIGKILAKLAAEGLPPELADYFPDRIGNAPR